MKSHEAEAVPGNGSDAESDEVFSASSGLICTSEMSEWLVNSGTSRHMTCDKPLLFAYKTFANQKL